MNIGHFLSLMVKDNSSPRVLLLRLAPIAIGFALIIGWGLHDRSQMPASVPVAEIQRRALPMQDVGVITLGTPVSGTLEPDERQAWTLTGTKGQRFAVTLGGGWNSHLALYMPDGIQTLTQDGFSGGNGVALIDGVTLPADGAYKIVVSGEQGGAGSYELRLTEAAAARPGTLRQVGDGGLLIVR